MATEHVVKQGEHLSAIAREHGFSDFRVIWDDPGNSELKALRKNPNVLLAGDVLQIPDLKSKEEKCAAGKVHKFQVGGATLMLRFKLRTLDQQPAANVACVLDVDGNKLDVTSDGDGMVERPIPATAKEGKLVVPDLALDAPVRIGHLDPVDTTPGQIARLNNLGYNAGPPEASADDPSVRSAIEEFQCDNGLPVDGVSGDATQAKLLEIHGC